MTKQVELPDATAWRNFDGEGGYMYTDNDATASAWHFHNGEKYDSWLEELFTADQMRQFRDEGIKDALVKLHPMYWTKEMSDAWHKAIPDVSKAFNDLIQASHQSQAKGESDLRDKK